MHRIGKLSRGWRRIDVFVWTMALTPLLILPPALAFLIAWRRHAVEREPAYDPTWVSLAVLGNVMLSMIVLVRFENELYAILGSLAHIASPFHTSPTEKPGLTPI